MLLLETRVRVRQEVILPKTRVVSVGNCVNIFFIFSLLLHLCTPGAVTALFGVKNLMHIKFLLVLSRVKLR